MAVWERCLGQNGVHVFTLEHAVRCEETGTGKSERALRQMASFFLKSKGVVPHAQGRELSRRGAPFLLDPPPLQNCSLCSYCTTGCLFLAVTLEEEKLTGKRVERKEADIV